MRSVGREDTVTLAVDETMLRTRSHASLTGDVELAELTPRLWIPPDTSPVDSFPARF